MDATFEKQKQIEKQTAKILFLEILSSLAVVLVIFLCSVGAVLVSTLGLKDINDKILTWWGKTCCQLANVQLDVRGLERLPAGGVIFVFNHVSLFDIIFIYAAIPKRIRFGAKSELFKIPIFGQAMKASGTLPIPRENKVESLSIYSQAAKRTSRGESFALAPEGTRQSGHEIGTFKTGPFLLAIESKAPLVPVVIKGAERVLSKQANRISLRGDRTVYIEILPAIETKNLSSLDRKKMRDDTRSSMQQVFAKLPN